MDSDQLLLRTKKFALTTIKFFQNLPRTDEARILGKQILRSGTSMAANYRAACRSRSKQEFYAKICIVVEESDETLFWFELLSDAGIVNPEESDSFQKEAQELLFIFSATKRSTKQNLNQ